MRRRWLSLSLAVAAGLVALAAFAQGAAASVGVGVQVGPVRLGTVADRGGNYSLPPVFVVNTGTQAEAISVRVERLSPGPGLVVPPSWVSVTGSAVQLAPGASAKVPLELAVPGQARPGGYRSDIVVTGSPAGAAPGAHIGVAAATKLEFSVSSRSAPAGPGLIPPWLWWILAGLIVTAALLLGARRFNLRITVERKTPAAVRPAQGNHVADEE
jgi:hypothetical protein